MTSPSVPLSCEQGDCTLLKQSIEHMARALLRRARSISAAAARVTPRFAAAECVSPRFTAAASSSSSSSAVAPLRSPLDERLLHLLRSEISYIADRRPPYPPPSSFKSFSMDGRPGEQWVCLRAARPGAVAEEVKVEATMFDGTADPLPEDAPLFQRVESLERGPRLHLSLIVEVVRGDRVLEFMCSAWPDELAVNHVITLRKDGGSGIGFGLRDFVRLEASEREAVIKFLKDREVDEELAGFLHEYIANKEKMELLRWLKTIESFIEK